MVWRNSIGSSTVTMWSVRVRFTRSMSAAQRGRLAGARRPGHEHQSAGQGGEAWPTWSGMPRSWSGLISVGIEAEGAADRAALLVVVHAEPRVGAEREREVQLEVAARTAGAGGRRGCCPAPSSPGGAPTAARAVRACRRCAASGMRWPRRGGRSRPAAPPPAAPRAAPGRPAARHRAVLGGTCADGAGCFARRR